MRRRSSNQSDCQHRDYCFVNVKTMMRMTRTRKKKMNLQNDAKCAVAPPVAVTIPKRKMQRGLIERLVEAVVAGQSVVVAAVVAAVVVAAVAERRQLVQKQVHPESEIIV
jgi:hypothetical protein